MSRQRIPAERRRVLRRQALEAGVPWTAADEYEQDAEMSLAEAADAFGAGLGEQLTADEEINRRRTKR